MSTEQVEEAAWQLKRQKSGKGVIAKEAEGGGVLAFEAGWETTAVVCV